MILFEPEKCLLEGSNLIEASAGTGKTYAISLLFLRLILEKRLLVNEILVVTFTVAATEELKSRIRGILKEAYSLMAGIDDMAERNDVIASIVEPFKSDDSARHRVKESIADFDRAAISTIHSFCQSVLLENAFESGIMFDAEMVSDNSDTIREIVQDYWRKNLYSAPKYLIDYVLKNRLNPLTLSDLANEIPPDPDCKFEPVVNRPYFGEIEKRALKKFKELQEEWHNSKDVIRNILDNSDSLNRKSYSKKKIQELFAEMDIFLRGDEPAFHFDGLEKFSISGIRAKLKSKQKAPEHKFFDLCEEYMNIYDQLQENLNLYTLYFKRDFILFVKEEIEKRKLRSNLRSFNDLLTDVNRALAKGGRSGLASAVRRKYRAALVDEFQDTDPIQFNIFSKIFDHRESILFLIGDPKQAIYSFRGGDIFAYMKALKNIKKKYTMGINWRSHENLVRSINRIFAGAEKPFIFHDIKYKPVRPSDEKRDLLKIDGKEHSKIKILFLDESHAKKDKTWVNKEKAERVIASSVAFEISKLLRQSSQGRVYLEGEPLKASHIAVLVRKNYQASVIKECLGQYEIPSVLYGAESVFSTNDAREMNIIISAIAEPGSESLVKGALATRIIGYTGNEIYEISEDPESGQKVWDRFNGYNRLWHESGFIVMFNKLLLLENVKERIIAGTDGERILTNILHCAELIHRYEVENNPDMDGIVKWFSGKISDDRSGEDQIRLESDHNAVKIITTHRSKGLEFPIVFCPFTWEGSNMAESRGKPFIFKFHEPGNNRPVIDLGTGDERNRLIAQKEELAENIRLFYVSITRAKYLCYLYWGRISNGKTSAPAYIFHNREEIVHKDILKYLAEKINALSCKDMKSDIERIAADSNGTIELSILNGDRSAGHFQIKKSFSELSLKKFTGKIDSNWMISSYSSLLKGRSYDSDSADIDEIYFPESKSEPDELNIFTFPRGAGPGMMIHEIFEKLDFTRINERESTDIINRILENYRFGLHWLDIICNMVRNVLTTSIDDRYPDLKLSKIDAGLRLNELDFYFPVKEIDSKDLARIFSDYGGDELTRSAGKIINDLGITERKGFMRGFIDLVFCYGSRFYIIDWKSNYLGNSIDDYNRDAMYREMYNNYYILQYHIYTVALHRYLKLRISDYDYDKYFGGVYYIFVRGVDARRGASRGIVKERPSPEIIKSLDEYFEGEGK